MDSTVTKQWVVSCKCGLWLPWETRDAAQRVADDHTAYNINGCESIPEIWEELTMFGYAH